MKGSLMKKGKWSKEEDDLIKNYIEKYGIGRSWQELSDTLGLGRCGRSCRARWLNYLRPGLKHGNFTPAEDRIIYQMYKRKGSCWSAIAAELPGRTDLAIKNYWNSTLKKRFPRTGRTSADATSLDLALVVYDEQSTSGTAALFVYSSEDSATTAPDLPLVVHNVNEANATVGSTSSHAGIVSAGSPVQARAQPPPPTAAAIDDPIAAAVPVSGPARDEATVMAGSSSSHAGFVWVGSPVPVQPPPPPTAAANEEPIAAVSVSGPVKMQPRTPPPPDDETSEEMDAGCCPMSPVPLGLMEPDLPCMTMDLPPIAGFDDIDSFLSYFDH